MSGLEDTFCETAGRQKSTTASVGDVNENVC